MVPKRLVLVTRSSGVIRPAICSSFKKDGFITIRKDLVEYFCDENLMGVVRELAVISKTLDIVNRLKLSFLILVNYAGLIVSHDNSLKA